MTDPVTRARSPAARRRSKSGASARGVLLEWPGVVARFSSVREGGPGRPASLLVVAMLAIALGYQGFRLLEQNGMDGAGPAMLFISTFLLASLAAWLLIKAVLRSRDVRFVLSEAGVEVRPSTRQKKLDGAMRNLALLSFLFTWKGGQWAAWKPFVQWKDVREVSFNDRSGEIAVVGGAWNIRLQCTPENFEQAAEIIRTHAVRARLTESKH